MLLEHAKSKIFFEKQILKELGSVLPDVDNIGRGVPSKPRRADTGMRPPDGPNGGLERGAGPNPPPAPPPKQVHIPPQALPYHQQARSLYPNTHGAPPSQVQPQASAYAGMSQSMVVPPTQTPESRQSGMHQPYPDHGSTYSSQGVPQGDPSYNRAVSPHQPLPHQGPTPTMAQSMYLPGSDQRQQVPRGYGGVRRIDDRVAAQSLANLF